MECLVLALHHLFVVEFSYSLHDLDRLLPLSCGHQPPVISDSVNHQVTMAQPAGLGHHQGGENHQTYLGEYDPVEQLPVDQVPE